MGILLDTCAWLWLFQNDIKIRHSECVPSIEDAACHDRLFVASISIWEVGMLAAKGRIHLKVDCLAWVTEAFNHGVNLTHLTPEIAIKSSSLPGKFHGDPADRILVATARAMDLSIVTADREIIEYGQHGFVKVISI